MKTQQDKIGNITIINADCMEVMSTLTNVPNSIIVTDPPFNIGYKYNSYSDRKKEDDYLNWLKDIIGSHSAVIVHYPEMLYKIARKIDRFPERVISWVYNSNTSKQHRDIAFFGVTPIMAQVIQPYKNLNDKRIQDRIARGIMGGKMYDWMNVNQVKNVSKAKQSISHPCQMPTEVMEKIIGVLPKGSTIIDPFMGSGTTGIACRELGYKFIGVELDAEYYALAKERITMSAVNL